MASATIKGRQNVFEWMTINEAPFWSIYDPSDTNKRLAESLQNANLKLDESIARMNSFFDLSNGGRFYVIIKTAPDGKSSGIYKTVIEVEGNTTDTPDQAQIGSIPSSGLVLQSEIDKAVAAARKEWESDQKIADLTRKIEEMQNGSRTEKIIEKAMPMIGKIIMSQTRRPTASAGIAGYGDSPVKEAPRRSAIVEDDDTEDDDYTIQLQQQLERLDTVLEDNGLDLLQVMTKLADMAETNPAMIVNALSMIGAA